jgi:hypothetical protein
MIKFTSNNLISWFIISTIAFPYARFFISNIPVSLIIIFITLLFLKIKISKVYLKYFSLVLFLFISLSLYHVYNSNSFYIIFNNLNRFFSVTVFFLFASYLQNNNLKEKLSNAVAIGLKVSLALFFTQFFLYFFSSDLLLIYYDVIFNFISSSTKFFNRYDVIISEGFQNRFSGAYHNPNSFAMSVVLCLTHLLYFAKSFKQKYLVLALSLIAILLTGSKQGIFCFSLLLLFYYRFSYITLIPIIIFGLFFIDLDFLNRFNSIEFYFNSISERSWGYDNFLKLIESDIFSFLFGTGINILSLRHFDVFVDYNGFVSNSILLIISFVGIVGLIGKIFIAINLINFKKYFKVLFLLFSYCLFDNHFAILESFQVLFFLIFSFTLYEKKKKHSIY